MSDSAGIYAQIVELLVTADESADSFEVTGVRFYRGRHKLTQADPEVIDFSGGTASATGAEVQLGSVLPPPTVIRLVPTFQA